MRHQQRPTTVLQQSKFADTYRFFFFPLFLDVYEDYHEIYITDWRRLLMLCEFQSYLYVRAICLSEIFVCQSYLFVKAICFSKLFVCQSYLFAKAICLSRLLVFQSYVF